MNKLPHLSADRKYEIICQSVGARPQPRITWWKDAVRLRDSREMVSVRLITSGMYTCYGEYNLFTQWFFFFDRFQASGNGNVTTSTLVLTPRIDDHGKVLKCQADNKLIPHSVKEDSWELVVHRKFHLCHLFLACLTRITRNNLSNVA